MGLCLGFASRVRFRSPTHALYSIFPPKPQRNPEKKGRFITSQSIPHDLPQEALEEVIEKLQELTGTARASADGGSAGEHSSNLMGDEDLGFPTLEPVPGHLALVED